MDAAHASIVFGNFINLKAVAPRCNKRPRRQDCLHRSTSKRYNVYRVFLTRLTRKV